MSACKAGCACRMVSRCFRHQWPELYGGASVEEVDVPANLRYGGGEMPPSTEHINVEEMGNAERLD